MEFTDLANRVEQAGVRIVWAHLTPGHTGAADPATSTIYLDTILDATPRHAISTLAHELGHLTLGHTGPQPAHIEAATDEWAARLLISPVDYATAEHLLGPNPYLLAVELGVTEELIHAWQRIIARSFSPESIPDLIPAAA
ncbi:ImmA/IrrE family metallo-endopeptidase [Actinobaculum sp. 352]|uniref:ImmA/IrrE family metallo-endopeptidase n=1 Tax=Actinobaculum sp. 352 TaxID=2490946 RepID=UPI000F7F66A2|nr:ImmA/IrrE family metallo-endopeptidase [Actinobaculum sp. 352]RTE49609.1 ImmA/IrrE family metallo-endopeptidase [Actinobaculum sp. 352]